MLQKISSTKPFTPNFKGNAQIEKIDTKGSCTQIILNFDPRNNYGDSLDFANAMAIDSGAIESAQKTNFDGAFPQQIYTKLMGENKIACAFDSQITKLNIIAYADEPRVRMFMSTDGAKLPENHDVSNRLFEYIVDWKKTKRRFTNSFHSIKNIIENLDNYEKDPAVKKATSTVLKKMREIS